MSKPYSIAIHIFATFEVLVGFFGSILLLKNFMLYLAILLNDANPTGMEGAKALVGTIVFLPAPLLLCAGLGVFISYFVGKKMHNMLLSFMYVLLMLSVAFHIYSGSFKLILLDAGVFVLITLPIQWFLCHPMIKELETRQY